jgi:hypothetical protein
MGVIEAAQPSDTKPAMDIEPDTVEDTIAESQTENTNQMAFWFSILLIILSIFFIISAPDLRGLGVTLLFVGLFFFIIHRPWKKS